MLLQALEQMALRVTENDAVDDLLDEGFQVFPKNDKKKWQILL